jgi:NADH-quinone oxidoreductase subunit L
MWTAMPAKVAHILSPLTRLSENKFYVDEIYDYLIIKPLDSFSRFLWNSFDQGAVDFTVIMTAKSVDASGYIASRLQSGQLRMYALSMFVGALLLLTFYIVL